MESRNSGIEKTAACVGHPADDLEFVGVKDDRVELAEISLNSLFLAVY